MESEVKYCENFNLSEVVTPVKANLFASMLQESNYEEDEMRFLHRGFTEGFDICYEGPQEQKSEAENIPIMVGNETILWNKLMKEVALHRAAGPFREVPFDNYIQLPIGLVPKVGGDGTRLIFHLSYDFKRDKLGSVNHFMAKDKCSVHYHDIDTVVQTFLRLWEQTNIGDLPQDRGSEDEEQRVNRNSKWKGTWKTKFKQHQRIIYSGKSDLKSAFCILGLSPKCFAWLVMKARNPITKEWCFFVDKCLPVGESISCALFQRFSDALAHLTQYKLKVSNRITNYLDDFLFVTESIFFCNWMIEKFVKLCDQLGTPVSMEKTEWASDRTIFLGILLDGRYLVLVVPEEKRRVATMLLEEFKAKKKATVKDLQKLCGYLNFLCKTIFPGWTFVRRMYAKYGAVVNLNGSAPKNQYEYKLKQHHHVKLDPKFKADCEVWLSFLNNSELPTLCRQMVDVNEKEMDLSSVEIGFTSDASATEDLGFGATFGTRWIQGDWGPAFIKYEKPSIEYLELFAPCAGIFTWQKADQLSNQRITLWCDNIAVIQMINNLTSGCERCMKLI